MPVFQGLRDDVDPRTVRRELAEDVAEERGKAERSVTARARPQRSAPTSSPDGSVPSTPLSQAAARIAAQFGTKVRGASAAELEALDKIQREGDWAIGGRRVHLTNLDKVLFPEDGLTKRDLVKYYVQVAPVLIPYFSQRPLSMNPHPDGIHGKSYWVKDKPDYAPDWIPTFRYRDEKSEKDWILVEETATLAWLANHAVIDLHPWYSRRDKPEYPDWSVVDLDPAQGATFPQVVQVARVLKSALDHLELKGVLKTTGQSGLHIYIPIERRYTLEQSRGFVEKLARMIGSLLPDLVTDVWEVKRRTGKIRIDYTQNVMNKTLAGPYSVRPAVHAPVSTPISWDELDDPKLRPDGWTIATIGNRLLEVGDLFREALTLHQRLPKLQ
jgi:bifunctional non-homologous end joining protein LigD